ncbi:hypothetical protein B0T16DRAFT_457179 [Cercophora newfieldiana]|uniref:Uncharacterized protein n=1 Tax=Cercophora newfieldiana TaxID=92897 RepID=A0AA39YBX3_9PEZI|nr:hypothetical protein B0T16DRAFT_457179 [Cercophora newfieldiana]
MCIYDYTPYTGCPEGQQHFFLQWMKCTKASGSNDKYCPIDKSVPSEELRKLSGNVLGCPLHRHIAVQQHEFQFAQGDGCSTAAVNITQGSSSSVAQNNNTTSSLRGPSDEQTGGIKTERAIKIEVNDKPYIDFGEELRREAREKKAKEAARRTRQISPNLPEEDAIARPRNPSGKTFEEKPRNPPARSFHRRGVSEDLRTRDEEFEASEESQRPRSYQEASKYYKNRKSEDEPLPSPRKIPVSPQSPKSAKFDTSLVNDNAIGLPARPNVYRRSAESSPIDPEIINIPPLRPKRPSDMQSPSMSDSTDDIVPQTPSPFRTTHRTSTGSTSGTVAPLRKIEERPDTEKERTHRSNSSDRTRQRSISADRKPSRAPSSNRGRERDILDRLRDERPDPTSNIAVSRHRRQASTDVTTPPSTQTQTQTQTHSRTQHQPQPHRSRSRSADPQPQPSRTASTDRDRDHPRSSSQTSLSRRPSTSNGPVPTHVQPPSRPPSRTHSRPHSRDPSPSTGPTRPLPSVPTQTHWAAELTRRNSDAKTYMHNVAPSRKWVSPPPSVSVSVNTNTNANASPVSPVSPATASNTASPSSVSVGSAGHGHGHGHGHTVRWNLPHQASESGVGLGPSGTGMGLGETVESPTLGNGKRYGFVQGLGVTQGQSPSQGYPKRESHDSEYASYQGGHRRGVSSTSASASASESSPSTGTGPDFGGLKTPGLGVSMSMSMGMMSMGLQQQGDLEVPEVNPVQVGLDGIPVVGHPTGQKKLVKTREAETVGLPSPPYGTKLNVPRPLPDAAYLPLPGEERGGGLLSKRSLGKLKRTLSGMLDKEKGKKVSVV